MTNDDEPKTDEPTDIQPGVPQSESGALSSEGIQSAEVVLIQVAEDAAVVFGENSPSWLDVQPILGATSQDRSHLTDAAALAAGAGNVVLQLSPAVLAAQGVVQLSPATLAALEAMSPVVGANGWNIGTLAAGAAQFGHSVQWAPMAAASGVRFAASLGPAVALLAIQLQLRSISRKLDKNIALTEDVLAELRWSNDTELSALVRDVKRAYEEAVEVGAVTAEIYGEIRGKEHLLDKSRTLLATRIRSYVDELDRTTTRDGRRKWLSDHGERCLDDLQLLTQVHQAWFVYQALRAANVAEADTSDRGANLVARIRRTATDQNDSTVELIVELADRLQRALGLLEESGNRRLGRFKSAREARDHARAIRQAVLTTVPSARSTPSDPEVRIGRSDKLHRAIRLLPLLRGIDERPALAASCILDEYKSAFLFVLPEEVIVTRERALLNDHRLEHRLPISSIRFVRDEVEPGKMSMATRDGFFAFRWASDADADSVIYGSKLLRSLMTLPAGEVPARPLPPREQLRQRLELRKAELQSKRKASSSSWTAKVAPPKRDDLSGG